MGRSINIKANRSVTMGNSMEVPPKIKSRTTICSSSFTSGNCPKGGKHYADEISAPACSLALFTVAKDIETA